MHLTTSNSNGIQVVSLPAKTLDAANSSFFKTAMEELIARNPRVVLDLSQTDFLDSSGCGALLYCFRKACSNGGDFKICSVKKEVAALFDLLKLHQVIDVFKTQEEAVQAFS